MIKQTRVENGLVRGIPAADPRIISYKGIPFAAPPVGELRWRAPQPAKDWEGVLDCSRFAPISMQQVPGSQHNIYEREWNVDPDIPMDEDCRSFCSELPEQVSPCAPRLLPMSLIWSSTE